MAQEEFIKVLEKYGIRKAAIPQLWNDAIEEEEVQELRRKRDSAAKGTGRYLNVTMDTPLGIKAVPQLVHIPAAETANQYDREIATREAAGKQRKERAGEERRVREERGKKFINLIRSKE